MGRQLSDDEKKQVADGIVSFAANLLAADARKITDETHIAEDLGGDSLFFISLTGEIQDRYGVRLDSHAIVQYFMRNPVHTIGDTCAAVCSLIESGDELLSAPADRP